MKTLIGKNLYSIVELSIINMDVIKGGVSMLTLIERFMQPDSIEKGKTVISNRIGIAKGQKLYDDDYDFDEMNPEIEKMFVGMK